MNRRVYQIAREQGLTSRELLDRLRAADVEVTTASSNVDDELALRILADGNGATSQNGDRAATALENETATAGGIRMPTLRALSNSVFLSFSATLVVVVVVSGAVGWGLSVLFSSTPASSAASSAYGSSSRSAHRGWNSVAVARYGELTIYTHPVGGRKMFTLSRPVASQPLTLLVRQRRASWVQTYLPMRPNGALGWVHRTAIRLLRDPWAVVIRLHTHRLVLRRAGRLIRTFPIAIGKPSTPTPTGRFFINELLKQPDPAGAYGPYAFGTSDFSDVIRHFGNGGNGQIGIHGTDQPWVIGTSASHGCIRLYNRDIVWLAQRIPLGTPVRITE